MGGYNWPLPDYSCSSSRAPSLAPSLPNPNIQEPIQIISPCTLEAIKHGAESCACPTGLPELLGVGCVTWLTVLYLKDARGMRRARRAVASQGWGGQHPLTFLPHPLPSLLPSFVSSTTIHPSHQLPSPSPHWTAAQEGGCWLGCRGLPWLASHPPTS